MSRFSRRLSGVLRFQLVTLHCRVPNIAIEVNGEPREVKLGSSVGDLLVDLGFADRPVAVERNRHVVPRAEHPTTTIEDGDRLEVVSFVGGG